MMCCEPIGGVHVPVNWFALERIDYLKGALDEKRLYAISCSIKPTLLPTTPMVRKSSCGFCYRDHGLEDVAGLLVECFDGREHFAVGQRLCLTQHALGAVLIDIESKNLPAKLAVDDDLATDTLSESSNAREQQQGKAYDGEGSASYMFHVFLLEPRSGKFIHRSRLSYGFSIPVVSQACQRFCRAV